MQTIALANPKGGVGRTTLAIHLGRALAERKEVALFDADGRGPRWYWPRPAGRFTPYPFQRVEALRILLDSFPDQLAVVDCPSTKTEALALVLERASVVLAPTRTDFADIEITEGFLDGMAAIGKRTMVVLNMVPDGELSSLPTRGALRSLGCMHPIAPTLVRSRAEYIEIADLFASDPEGDAIREIRALAADVLTFLGNGPKSLGAVKARS